MNRNVAFRSLLFVCTSLVLSGPVWADDAEGKSPAPPLRIQKIYFMFHPVCWRNFGATPPPAASASNSSANGWPKPRSRLDTVS